MIRLVFSRLCQRFCQTCLLVLVVGCLAGCRSVRRGEPFGSALPIENPQTARGQLVFMQHCHLCHPGGEGGLGPGINDKPLPRFLIKTQVRLGMGAMPSFGTETISPEELDDLATYLVALRRSE